MVVYKAIRNGYDSHESQWEPPTIIRGALTTLECAELINFVETNKMLSTSKIVDIKTEIDQQVRRSETAWVNKSNPIALKLCTIAASLAKKTIDCCEDMQVVKYEAGGFYKAHHDACCDDTPICDEFQKRGGQRIGTLLVYLNDSFTDGETHFPLFRDSKFKVPPGDAIFFHPLGEDDKKCHPHALHGGLPISSGVKYICNIWVRESQFI
jgi:prolyl 4-hydroxylase